MKLKIIILFSFLIFLPPTLPLNPIYVLFLKFVALISLIIVTFFHFFSLLLIRHTMKPIYYPNVFYTGKKLTCLTGSWLDDVKYIHNNQIILSSLGLLQPELA